MKEQYHHGNLKNELIQNAITIIAENGVDALSLRSISSRCGVSHNAVYRHFESKEKLIGACREFVETELTERLLHSIEGLPHNEPDTIDTLSYSYIDFFAGHPAYFYFIYGGTVSPRIVFTFEEGKNTYRPFELFRMLCVVLSERYRLTEEDGIRHLVKYWALIQGITSLVVSESVQFDGDCRQFIKGIF